MSTRPHPDLLESGKIASRVRDEIARQAKPGVSVLKLCQMAESKIVEYGATGPAFPCNISIDEEAAHYTSPRGDSRILPERGLVKIDLGAHVNGHLSDTAVTVDMDGSYSDFVNAAQSALNAAIDLVRPDVELGAIGAAIERSIKRTGLNPVYQLSGHQMEPWILHAGKSVPNIETTGTERMERGEVYAIEPFSTNGPGSIRAGQATYIFSNVPKARPKLDRLARQLRNTLRKRFRSLPFASRWVRMNEDVHAAFGRLLQAGAVRGYPVLVEGKGGMVAQFEHTVFVAEDGAVVTTQG
ncbi:type II methionyl aminopeptidase [Candidatus Thorarchaeota archaeon]|nr:MAG: type II methionyl aminopeptidase [Candidatus Thorarchaeota archaeon]